MSARGNRQQTVGTAIREIDRPATIAKLTGAIVGRYVLSGWRRDKAGHYRMWLGLVPFTAATVMSRVARVGATLPKLVGNPYAAQTSICMINGATVTMKRAAVDSWLRAKIAAYDAAKSGSE